MPKYPVPEFLHGQVDQAMYARWLHGRASAHVKRDRKRGNPSANVRDYKAAIHSAVVESGGRDRYTGEWLEWVLIGTYDNVSSRTHRREYKKAFALLPSVDHVGDGLGPAEFCICAWRTNDCKNDLSHDELVAFSRKIVRHAERGGA